MGRSLKYSGFLPNYYYHQNPDASYEYYGLQASIGSTGHKYPEARSKEDRNDQRGGFVFDLRGRCSFNIFSVDFSCKRCKDKIWSQLAKYVFLKFEIERSISVFYITSYFIQLNIERGNPPGYQYYTLHYTWYRNIHHTLYIKILKEVIPRDISNPIWKPWLSFRINYLITGTFPGGWISKSCEQ